MMWLVFASCLLFETAEIVVENESTNLDLDNDGFTVDQGDCDDQDNTVYPNAPEVCDGVDNDCNGLLDISWGANEEMQKVYSDADGDGFGSDESFYACSDTTGWSENALDCDDDNPNVSPEVFEICDGVDNDCNGLIDDEDDTLQTEPRYIDEDGDGYGGGVLKYTCDQDGTSALTGDCNDFDPFIGPSMEEEPFDLVDQDCDGLDITSFDQCGVAEECAEVLKIGNIGIPFQRIEAGMDPLERYEIVDDLMMMSVEMTQLAVGYLGLENTSTFTSGSSGQKPVETVTWHQAALIANKLTEYANGEYALGWDSCYQCQGNGQQVWCEPAPVGLDCTGYRLPTNAEWEFASRAGTALPFSSDGTADGGIIDQPSKCDVVPEASQFTNNPALALTDFAWYCVNSPNKTQPVAQLAPNANFLYDMQGNVFEWTNSVEGEDLSGSNPWLYDPQVNKMIIRGGAFLYPASFASHDLYEIADAEQDSLPHIGFRLMRRLAD